MGGGRGGREGGRVAENAWVHGLVGAGGDCSGSSGGLGGTTKTRRRTRGRDRRRRDWRRRDWRRGRGASAATVVVCGGRE